MAKEMSSAEMIKAAIEAHSLKPEWVLSARVAVGPALLRPIPPFEERQVELGKDERAVLIDTSGGQLIVWRPGDEAAPIPDSHHPEAKPRPPKRAAL